MANNTLGSRIAVCITSPQPTGYRRANLTLSQGINNLSVTSAQLEILKTDPRLAVQELPTQENPISESALVAGSLHQPVDGDFQVDLAGVPEELHPFVAVMMVERFEDKPTVDQLTIDVSDDVNGEKVTGKHKPTAAQRDAAWKLYQEASARAESEQ
ncbi:HI1506-related protein [Pseudoalteromonas obscura]|uniref:HI1506-related protein n=1 Tax=Pseudoalteromonas obscura TaxID=3048491 RepID=A0ABT7EUD5_9GAMM|nr:HI1506-related protein [Pseudoalteromonas sp. P94(2023)]MDK2598659.1 HI1506-related protein [Pseudoalteromonas sp. P94(2023)]